jgi:hypothetical protein
MDSQDNSIIPFPADTSSSVGVSRRTVSIFRVNNDEVLYAELLSEQLIYQSYESSISSVSIVTELESLTPMKILFISSLIYKLQFISSVIGLWSIVKLNVGRLTFVQAPSVGETMSIYDITARTFVIVKKTIRVLIRNFSVALLLFITHTPIFEENLSS